jgi:hypothetical protein
MDKAFKKQAEEWFERGLHDIETAQLLYDERSKPFIRDNSPFSAYCPQTLTRAT